MIPGVILIYLMMMTTSLPLTRPLLILPGFLLKLMKNFLLLLFIFHLIRSHLILKLSFLIFSFLILSFLIFPLLLNHHMSLFLPLIHHMDNNHMVSLSFTFVQTGDHEINLPLLLQAGSYMITIGLSSPLVVALLKAEPTILWNSLLRFRDLNKL